jgi:heme/copper-type cytochrome/quinol oxidase subunit 2
MPLGTSIFLIAVGAILRWAVTASTSGIDLKTVGLILIIVGIVGIVLSLFYMTLWSPRRRERLVEREPYEEPPPRTY